jgi:hypothetical protein
MGVAKHVHHDPLTEVLAGTDTVDRLLHLAVSVRQRRSNRE